MDRDPLMVKRNKLDAEIAAAPNTIDARSIFKQKRELILKGKLHSSLDRMCESAMEPDADKR